MQTTTPSTRIGRILLALLILTLSPLAWTHSSPLDIQTAHAQGGPVNIITNADFEGGVFTDSRGFQVPDNWSFETCEGVENATVDLDNSQWADGVNSTRVDTGPIRNTGCLGPNMRQTANCTGSSQTSLDCNFSFPLIAQSILAFCMGMSGTGNTLSVSDTQGNAFSIKQEVNTNVHIACGYSTTYTSSGSDLVTLTFQSNTFTDFAVVYEVAPDSTNHQITVAPVSDSGPCTGTGSGLNLACDTQVAASGPPFIFSMAASTTPMGTYSAGNNFVKTTIAATGNAQYSNSSLVANTSCMSSGTNSVSYGVVCVFLRNARFSNRTVGFSQFRQSTQGVGYNITQLTDDPAGFSFWFKLQPDNSNGMAGFEIRIFGAEALAELDYAINPDPSVGMFQNNTSNHSLLFYGYQPGQWYHFSRNLRADWLAPMGPANTPLNLNYNFTLIQFQGFATKTGTTIKSETFWLDNVRVYEGAGQVPPDNQQLPQIRFTDTTGYDVSNKISFTILDPSGNTVPYTYGKIVPPGNYLLEASYEGHQTYKATLSFTNTNSIPLQMLPLDQNKTAYLAVNGTATGMAVFGNSQTRVTFTFSGTGPYQVLVDLPFKPLFVERNGARLSDTDWTYNATSKTLSITTPAAGTFDVVLQQVSTDFLTIAVISGIVAAAVIIIAGVLLVRRRRLRRGRVSKIPLSNTKRRRR